MLTHVKRKKKKPSYKIENQHRKECAAVFSCCSSVYLNAVLCTRAAGIHPLQSISTNWHSTVLYTQTSCPEPSLQIVHQRDAKSYSSASVPGDDLG